MVTGVTEDIPYKLGELDSGGISHIRIDSQMAKIQGLHYSCYSFDKTNKYLLDNAKIPIQL